jgi:ferredoxin-thioredoxin reductase catalytic subunit
MRRLWQRFVLWGNNICTKHLVKKQESYGWTTDWYCPCCYEEESARQRQRQDHRANYLESILAEWRK